MSNQEGSRRIYIDCYDANGFYEENYERIMLVMHALAPSESLGRKWVSSQAVGGSWARSIRCMFETTFDVHYIKSLTVGLEYRNLDEVPESLHPQSRSQLFRFADIDVIELRAKGKMSRLLGALKLDERKIGKAELSDIGSGKDFALTCRKRLVENLELSTRNKLFELEQRIFQRLQDAGSR